MMTVREVIGFSVFALVSLLPNYVFYFTGRRYPWWLVPGQGEDGRQVAALNLTMIVAATVILVGGGTGWLVSALTGLRLHSGWTVATAVIAGAVALVALGPAAWRLWPQHAARIDAARARRLKVRAVRGRAVPDR